MHNNDFDEHVSGRIHEGREELADLATIAFVFFVVMFAGLFYGAL